MDTAEQKKQLRKEIKQKKTLLNGNEATEQANAVFAGVEAMDEFQSARVVLAFWSMPDEIPTHGFVTKWSRSKKIVLPVVVGNDLELREFDGTEQLEQSNNYGIMEPKTGKIVDPKDIDFAIIPGIAFDKKGNRLGRGKGFYDRTMNLLGEIPKVGVGYEFQLVDWVPVTEFDLPVNRVICQ